MISVSIVICLLLKPFAVTRNGNSTQTGLNTKRESIPLRIFPKDLPSKAKSPPGLGTAGLQGVSKVLVSPGLSVPIWPSAAHVDWRPLRRRTTERGLGSHPWELAPCLEKGKPNSEFGSLAFPKRGAQEPSCERFL